MPFRAASKLDEDNDDELPSSDKSADHQSLLNGGAESHAFDAFEKARPSRPFAALRRSLPSLPSLPSPAVCLGVVTVVLLYLLYTSSSSPRHVPTIQPSGIEPTVTPPKHSISMCADCRADKALVVASYDGAEDWIERVPDDWTVYTYALPDREPLAYLNFIVDNYHRLPDYTVFAQGHRTAWHQVEPLPWKLAALNLTALDHEGYISLRCAHDPGCTPDTFLGAAHAPPASKPLAQLVGEAAPWQWWERMMRPFGFGAYPDEIGGQCCSQFAVTRSAVLARSVDFYKAYREPVDMTPEAGRDAFGESWSPAVGAKLYEYMWHIVFGRAPVHCPAEDTCRDVFFSHAIACDNEQAGGRESEDWKNVHCTNTWDGQLRHAEEEESRQRYVPPVVPDAAA